MRKLTLPLAIAATFFLAACSDDQPVTAGPLSLADSITTKVYQCAEDGTTFEVVYAGDTATLTLDDKEYLLKQAVAASGARYVSDDGLEWHVKGDEGAFGRNDDTQMCTLAE